MPKRTMWFATGTVVGLSSSYWVQRRVRQMAARLAPSSVGREVAGSVRQLGSDVAAAVAEGREAARAKEAELSAEMRAADRPHLRALPGR